MLECGPAPSLTPATSPTTSSPFPQVFERLLAEWCANGEVVPGFKRFAMEQLGGEACVLGLLRTSQGLDARDAATAAFIGEVAAALKLLYGGCGACWQLLGSFLGSLLVRSGG